MFVRNGTLKKWGCKKCENCSRYHPPHCSTSLANKTCYDPNCTRPHLVGTKRKNEQYTQKEPTNQQPPGVGASTANTTNTPGNAGCQERPTYRRSEEQRRPQTCANSAVNPDENARFLELRSLLTKFQCQMQLLEEVKQLRSQITQISQFKGPVPLIQSAPQYYPSHMIQVVHKPFPAAPIPLPQQPITPQPDMDAKCAIH